jgi:SAM-dependent methyltransferase
MVAFIAPAPCILCKTKDFELLLVGEDKQHGVPGKWSLLKCLGCGLIATFPCPSQKELSSFYPEEYVPFTAFHPKKGTLQQKIRQALLEEWYGYPGKKRWTRKALLFPFFLVQNLKGSKILFYHGKGRLLEIGTGSAAHLYYLREQGWKTTGIEPNPNAAERAQKNHGLRVLTGTLEQTRFSPHSFDVVLMEYVFEHVLEPNKTLQRLHEILDKNGLFVLDVPNINALEFKLFKENWFPLELPRHVFHFSPKTLSALLEKHGFEIVKIQHDPTPKRFLQSLNYTFRIQGLEYNKLLHMLFFPFTFLFALLGRGASMRITAIKKNNV